MKKLHLFFISLFLASASSATAFDIRSTFFNNHPGASTLTNSPGTLLSSLLPNLMVIAAIIFFSTILFSGFKLIRNAGQDLSAQDAAKAKNTLTFGIVGFLIVISAFFILQIIKAVTGVDLINPPI